MLFRSKRSKRNVAANPARSRRPHSFRPTLQGLEERVVLSVSLHLVAPPSAAQGVNNSLAIEYANTGTTAAPAPLLALSADKADLWLPGDPAVRGSQLEVLATSPSGPAGLLAPGAQGTLVVDFTATTGVANDPINFSLSQMTPGQGIDWASLQAGLRPSTIPAGPWSAVFANFTANVGATTDSYQTALDADATYLAQVGEPTSDVTRLMAYEINKANGLFARPATTASVDASLPAPGPALAFTRSFLPTVSGRNQMGTMGLGWESNWDVTAGTDSQGNVTISAGGCLRFFARQADGSYLPTLGDHGVLTALAGGGYQLTEASGGVTVFNANGTLGYVQDTNGNRITAAYTGGLLSQLTDSNGSYLALGYTNGLLTRVADSTGRATNYTYDAAGQHLLTSTNAYGTTTYGYVPGQGTPAANALASIAFANGTHLFFSYDAEGRLSDEHQDGNQCDVQFSYPAGGITNTDAAGGQGTVLLDDSGQVVQATDPLGHVTLYAYDAGGNLTQVQGPQGATYHSAYDACGNVLSETDPLGLVTAFTYNARHALTGYTDAKGNVTQYGYDGNNNLLSVTYANGNQESFTYNPLGEATQFVSANGSPVGYTYNAQGLVASETFADHSSFSYTYDGRGNMLSAAGPAGTISFGYQDSAHPDLVTQVLYPNGQYLKFTYNTIGQRTQSVDQTGFTTNYAYDALGRLQKLTDAGGNPIVVYTYDAAGRLTQKDPGNGTRTVLTYDAAGNLLSLTNLAADHVTANSFDTYTYDALGNALTDTNQDGQWAYTYDADSQLTDAVFTPNGSNPDGTTGQNLHYAYDAAGNRVSQTVNGVTTTYAVNSVNEYTSSTTGGVTTTYQYDRDGNLVAQAAGGSTTTYTYNTLDQLIASSGPGTTAGFTYDPLGHQNSATVNGTTTQFLIDPFGLGNVASSYTGGSLAAHYTSGLGLVSQVDATGAAAYYDFDAGGNTVGLTGTRGAYVNRYTYLPFGATTTVAATLTTPFTFAGQVGVMQFAGNLVSMRARDYSPATGQFLSKDPTGLAGGDTNLERYVANNPIQYVDASGLTEGGEGETGKPREILKLTQQTTHTQTTSTDNTGSGISEEKKQEIQQGQTGKNLGIKPANGSEQLPDLTIDEGTNARIIHNYLLEGLGDRTVTAIETASGVAATLLTGAAEAEAIGGGILWLGNVLRNSGTALKAALTASGTFLTALPALSKTSGPADTATTTSTQPGTSGGGLIEGQEETVIAGNLIWGGNPLPPPTAFTAKTAWSDGVTTDDVVAVPGSLPDASGVTTPGATYDVYAARVFPEDGAYAVTGTTTIGGPQGSHWSEDNIAEIVYDAPMIVNPVNISVPVGGHYHGPIATFTDLNPYGDPADYLTGWVQSSTLIPATLQSDGGNSYTVIADVDFSNTSTPGSGSLIVRVWDQGQGPNPRGGADIVDNVTLEDPGAVQVSTSVSGKVLHLNGQTPASGTVATIDTTDPAITSAGQVTVTPGSSGRSRASGSGSASPVLITGETLTVLPGGVKRIAVQGIVNDLQPGSGPTTVPLTVAVQGEPTVTAQVGVDASDSDYLVNPVAVTAVAGQAVEGVQVATLTGPANAAYTATINWGDGETSSGQVLPLGGDSFAVNGSKPHPYAGAGVEQITVTVTGPGRIAPPPALTTALVQSGLAVTVPDLTAAAQTTFSGSVATFTDTDRTAAASSFSATITWGDGQTSAGTVSGANGTFTVSGGHAYAAEGRSPVAVTVTDTTGDSASATGTAHVARLGPPPSALLTVASILTHSAEYYGNVVIAAYQRYLGRSPAPSEVAGWVGVMQSGLSDEHLEAGFIGSPEYINNHGGPGAGWVTGMYVDLLGRQPAPSEVSGWVAVLNQGMAPAAVAYGFAASPEREGQRITADYQKYLNRTPEPGIVAAWVNAFESGMNNESVIAGFVGSQEYFQKHSDNIIDWLFSAYQDSLGRAPDPAALQGWAALLANS
jgi:RHS repeat-associated protein